MAKDRVSRPVPARIRMRIKDPARARQDWVEFAPAFLGSSLRNWGLVWDSPLEVRWSREDPAVLEVICTFVDEEAARTWPTHPEVARAFDEEFRKLLRGRPRTVRERDYFIETDDVRVCTCERPPWYAFQGLTFGANEVLTCGGCGGDVPSRLWAGGLAAQYWGGTYRHIDSIWLRSGVGEAWAEHELSDVGSDLNREGRRHARAAERALHSPVYYQLFIAEPGRHSECPCCGRPSRESGSPSSRACRPCRLLFRHD